MPAMDEDACQISKVIWNDPFVTVQLYNGFGMSSDSIKFFKQGTNNLWDILPPKEKLHLDKNYQFIRNLIKTKLDEFKDNIEDLQDKKNKVPKEELVDPVNKLSKFFKPLENRNRRRYFLIKS